MAPHYLITKSSVGSIDSKFFADFDGAIRELTKYGMDIVPVDREESSTYVRLVYSDPDGKLKVILWNDYIADTRYLEVNTEDEELAREAVDVLRRHLQFEETSELLARVTKELEKAPKLIARLALSAPEKFDAKVFDAVRLAIGHENADVRRYAGYAAGLLGWHAFAPVLEARLEKEIPGETKVYLERGLQLLDSI